LKGDKMPLTQGRNSVLSLRPSHFKQQLKCRQ
jgi:hypothetical protein